jgi:hypothetical protein
MEADMGTATQEVFDVIIDCIQESLIKDAQQVERLVRIGRKANAAMIKNITEDAEKKISALVFVMTQTEWTKCEETFCDRSHHWAGVFG